MIPIKRAIGFLYKTERGQTHGETERERRECECRSAPPRSVGLHPQTILGRNTFD